MRAFGAPVSGALQLYCSVAKCAFKNLVSDLLDFTTLRIDVSLSHISLGKLAIVSLNIPFPYVLNSHMLQL